MATLQARILAAIEGTGGIGEDIALLKTRTGDIALLDTVDKTSLVNAINELADSIGAASGIDDGATATTSTWSSSKIDTEITDSATAVKADILGGAGAAYDTLQELKALLDASDTADDAALAAITTALGQRVRTDTNAQGLDSTQKQNARTNIDAYGSVELGNPDTDLLAAYIAAATP